MAAYSEVIQTMAAMVIFSLILLSANRMIIRNTHMEVQGELEQEVVAIAQNVIEESRTKEFDENTQAAAPPAHIPGDFTDPNNLGSEITADSTSDDKDGDGKVERYEFDDFDDYNGWQDTVSTEHGEFKIWAKVFYVDPNTYAKTSSRTTFKKIQVFVQNEFLKKGQTDSLQKYHLEFIRNYYAD